LGLDDIAHVLDETQAVMGQARDFRLTHIFSFFS
jgi:hypothetical protein